MKKLRAILIGIIILGCVGLGIFLVVSRNQLPPPPPKPPVAEAPVKPPIKARVFLIAFEGNEAKLRPIEVEIPAGEDPAEGALRLLIEQGDTDDLVNPIPKGARLLGLEVNNGLATVDLSKEFSDNFTGGSEDEALLIGAILRTLGQFPKIKKVQFKLEGEPLETLGHLDFSGPQDVNWVGTGFGGDN